MPEVAEIALTAEILNKYLKNKSILAFDFIGGRYTKKDPVGYQDFLDNLPLQIKKIDSKGKFLWFELVNNKKQNWYIFNTFGLTGMWSLEEPKYTKAIVSYDSGVVYFSDVRNFGTFKFTKNKNELKKKLDKLAPDFLKSDVDISKIRNYKIPIVKILMDQTKIGSGLGNYLVPEILYRAKISPHRLGSSLSKNEIAKLEYNIDYTTKLAYIDNHVGYMINLEDEANKLKRKNYHSYIKLKNKTFEFLVYRQKVDPKGNPVKRESIIKGRTTYWVPIIQK